MLDYLPELEYNMETYIFYLFCLVCFIQFIFVVLVYSRLAFFKDKNISANNEGVSIIIAARNESDNIFNFLPFILEQDYPEFEVVIINHQSTDDSKFILNAYKRQYPHLKIIEIEKSPHIQYGKKLPLTIGIKGAKYEQLLFTDADCKPASNQWLKSMANHFSGKHEIVLGYGPYTKQKGWLNKLIRFDTAWIAMNYFSFAKAKIPYMGIGRNMAYTKSVFNRVEGFKSHYSVSSGDDDLFIQDAARKKNYTINIDSDSYSYSQAPETWKEWMNQKSRHFTTANHYKVIKKLLLGIYPLSLLLMLISFVTLLFINDFVWLTLAIFTFIFILKWIILGLSMKKLNESKFIAILPLLDIIYAFLAPAMYYLIDRKDIKKW
tara:strand:+ start:21093 stop:22226 length:1134 start_codon:yes stop_codon:yes gene_type:complete